MKKLSLLIFLVILTLGAANAFATCPTAPTGPYFYLGMTAYEYTQDPSCYSFYGSGSTSSTTLDCGYSGWQFNYGSYVAERASFTIGSSDPIVNANHWTVNTYITAISPSHSSSDYFAVTAYVTHSNNTTDTYTLFTWDGSQSDLTGCTQEYVGFFVATHGDTVTIEERATNLGSGTFKATPPTIFNQT